MGASSITVTLSRRDKAKIARRFNAGKAIHFKRVPERRPKHQISGRNSQPWLRDSVCVHFHPGAKTPGYSQSSLWDGLCLNR